MTAELVAPQGEPFIGARVRWHDRRVHFGKVTDIREGVAFVEEESGPLHLLALATTPVFVLSER